MTCPHDYIEMTISNVCNCAIFPAIDVRAKCDYIHNIYRPQEREYADSWAAHEGFQGNEISCHSEHQTVRRLPAPGTSHPLDQGTTLLYCMCAYHAFMDPSMGSRFHLKALRVGSRFSSDWSLCSG